MTIEAAPAGGTYPGALSVYLYTGLPSYYTTDGSTPTAASTPYTGAISLTVDTTLKYIEVDGEVEGPVQTDIYVIEHTYPWTTATPSGGTYAEDQTVTLAQTEPAYYGIFYSLDGNDPTTYYPPATPLSVTSEVGGEQKITVLKFYAVGSAGNEPVKTETYYVGAVIPKLQVTDKSGNAVVSINLLGSGTTGVRPDSVSKPVLLFMKNVGTTTIASATVLAEYTTSYTGISHAQGGAEIGAGMVQASDVQYYAVPANTFAASASEMTSGSIIGYGDYRYAYKLSMVDADGNECTAEEKATLTPSFTSGTTNNSTVMYWTATPGITKYRVYSCNDFDINIGDYGSGTFGLSGEITAPSGALYMFHDTSGVSQTFNLNASGSCYVPLSDITYPYLWSSISAAAFIQDQWNVASGATLPLCYIRLNPKSYFDSLTTSGTYVMPAGSASALKNPVSFVLKVTAY